MDYLFNQFMIPSKLRFRSLELVPARQSGTENDRVLFNRDPSEGCDVGFEDDDNDYEPEAFDLWDDR